MALSPHTPAPPPRAILRASYPPTGAVAEVSHLWMLNTPQRRISRFYRQYALPPYRLGVRAALRPDPALHSWAGQLAHCLRQSGPLADRSDCYHMGLLHPCRFALAAGTAGMGGLHTRLPPLAPYSGRAAGPQLCVHAALDGPDLRNVLPAAEPMAVLIRHRNQDAQFAGAAVDPSGTPATPAGQLTCGWCGRPVGWKRERLARRFHGLTLMPPTAPLAASVSDQVDTELHKDHTELHGVESRECGRKVRWQSVPPRGFVPRTQIPAIAVGTRITARPPHRTVRADFPHTAPTSGI